MKFKHVKLLFVLMIIVCMFLTFTVVAQNKKIVDPEIPESWYEKPQTASELNINTFNQSSMLDKKVENGELLPVKERLPADPPVIEPYKEVGKYGGTATLWTTQRIEDIWNSDGGLKAWLGFMEWGRPTPDTKEYKPYLAKDWKYSDDYKTFTIYLREGMKWSDGEDFNAEDVMFWWKRVANNLDLNPTPPENWNPPIIEVEKIDNYTVQFQFEKPSPHFHKQRSFGWDHLVHPKHYMKNYHPDFVDEENLDQEVKKVGLDNWFELYEYKSSTAYPDRGLRPTLRPYIVVNRGENFVEFERNPYYPFVDVKGNQLPYVNEIRLNIANEREMMQMKASTGEATFAGRDLNTSDIPLYKNNEEKGDYKTLLYNSVGTDWTVYLNLTHKDSKLRKIFQEVNFRRALSLALDREEINKKVYFDRGTPIQASLVPGSKYIEPEFLESYIEYNPEKAKRLLDEIGMKDVDEDGYREYPDGEDFEMILDHWDPNATKIGEMCVRFWDEIGIETDFKQISWELNVQKEGAYESQLKLSWNYSNSDLRFPANNHFAPMGGWGNESWPAWNDWYNSDGESGFEPPEEIKELHEAGKILVNSKDEEKRIEAGKKIMKAQAENVWSIGTVGLIPRPVVIDEDLKNVPKTGYWGQPTSWLGCSYPVQTYLDE